MILKNIKIKNAPSQASSPSGVSSTGSPGCPAQASPSRPTCSRNEDGDRHRHGANGASWDGFIFWKGAHNKDINIHVVVS